MKETIRTASVGESYGEAEKVILERIAVAQTNIESVNQQERDELSRARQQLKEDRDRAVKKWAFRLVAIPPVTIVAYFIGFQVVGQRGIDSLIGVLLTLAVIAGIFVLVGMINSTKGLPTEATIDATEYNRQRKALQDEIAALQIDLDGIRKKKRAILMGEVIEASAEVNQALGQPAAQIPSPLDVIAVQGDKTCPMCAETIKAAARKCKHCGHLF